MFPLLLLAACGTPSVPSDGLETSGTPKSVMAAPPLTDDNWTTLAPVRSGLSVAIPPGATVGKSTESKQWMIRSAAYPEMALIVSSRERDDDTRNAPVRDVLRTWYAEDKLVLDTRTSYDESSSVLYMATDRAAITVRGLADGDRVLVAAVVRPAGDPDRGETARFLDSLVPARE
jgi:hypothetical protein